MKKIIKIRIITYLTSDKNDDKIRTYFPTKIKIFFLVKKIQLDSFWTQIEFVRIQIEIIRFQPNIKNHQLFTEADN